MKIRYPFIYFAAGVKFRMPWPIRICHVAVNSAAGDNCHVSQMRVRAGKINYSLYPFVFVINNGEMVLYYEFDSSQPRKKLVHKTCVNWGDGDGTFDTL